MKGIKISAALVVLGLGVSASTTQASSYYGGDLCAYDEFKCQKVKRSDTWAKLFPDEHQRELVKRLNRTSAPVTSRSWIVIPTDYSNLDYMDLSPFPQQLDEPTGKSHILVDLSDQAFGAYDASGQLVYWGPMSGGKGYCEDTNSYCRTAKGSFRIIRKQGPECVSSKFPLETDGVPPKPF